MSCGLGAIILVLMLVKYQSELPDTQASALQADIAAIDSQNQRSQELLQMLRGESNQIRAGLSQLNTQLTDLETKINKEQDTQQSLQSQLAKLQSQTDTSAQTSADPIPVANKKLEDYLLGLKVEGEKIVILVDSSASMTEERLIDIIRHKVAPARERRQAPKWRRTLRIVEWLVAKAPATSEYKVVHFAEQADFVGGSDWKKGADSGDAATVLADFAKIAPEGGTNLHAAVTLMRDSAQGFSNVYLITDGMPTQGKAGIPGAASALFSGCASITGKAQTISGKCRRVLLDNVISSYKESAPVNVILLPLEGDSGAAGAFWQWTAKNTGLLIAPETSWP